MNTPQQNEQPVGATEIDLLAADWLQRRNFWAWNEENERELEAWLAQSRAHRLAYWRQKAVWNNAQRLVALKPLTSPRVQAPAFRQKHPFAFRAAIAAAVVALLGIGSAFYFQQPKYEEAVYATPVGGRETIALFDGSLIELNTDTVLRVRKHAQARFAVLEKGEAYFNIKHNAAHPFMVTAADHRVTDLGTKFVVRNMPGKLEVSLLEGSASFGPASEGRGKPTVLSPGDVIVAAAQSIVLTRKTTEKLSTELGWRRGLLTFYRATLADAATEMNRYNERKIIIADAASGRDLIDGTFPANDVDLFGRMAHSVLGLRVSNKGDTITISR
jgi:transmembrane sensor